MALRNCHFRGSRCTRSRTLWKVVHEILTVFPTFSSDLGGGGGGGGVCRGDAHEHVSSNAVYCENWLSDFRILLRDVQEFVPVFSRICARVEWNSLRQICCWTLWVSWESAQAMPCVYYGRKWNFVCTCAVKTCDILKVKNALVMSAYCVTECTICSLVI
jgi:hypothetical protein